MKEEGQIPRVSLSQASYFRKAEARTLGSYPTSTTSMETEGRSWQLSLCHPLWTSENWHSSCLGSGSAIGPEIHSGLSWSTGNVEDYTT